MKRWTVALVLTGVIGFAPITGTVAAQEAEAPKRDGLLTRMPDGSPRTEYTVNPATKDPSVLVTRDDLIRWGTELSNWGRWGLRDEKGLLNLITPAKTVEAAKLVREGIVVSLTHFVGNVNFEQEYDSWRQMPARHWMASHASDGSPGAVDAISFGMHDGVNSHMDALCHYSGGEGTPALPPTQGQQRVTFNGYLFRITEQGCSAMGIERMGTEYVTRAVLYDIPALKGVPYLDPSTPIFVKDLEAWEAKTGAKVGPGDVMILRTGRWALREAEGPWSMSAGGAGLHASVLPWLKARDVSVLYSDARSGVVPSGVDGEGAARPIHQLTQVILGLPLVDNGWPEEAARVAQELGRWEFMIVWKNFHVPGATASPFNATAVF